MEDLITEENLAYIFRRRRLPLVGLWKKQFRFAIRCLFLLLGMMWLLFYLWQSRGTGLLGYALFFILLLFVTCLSQWLLFLKHRKFVRLDGSNSGKSTCQDQLRQFFDRKGIKLYELNPQCFFILGAERLIGRQREVVCFIVAENHILVNQWLTEAWGPLFLNQRGAYKSLLRELRRSIEQNNPSQS